MKLSLFLAVVMVFWNIAPALGFSAPKRDQSYYDQGEHLKVFAGDKKPFTKHAEVSKIIGYTFTEPKKLTEAFDMGSEAFRRHELLGDAVIYKVVTEHFYQQGLPVDQIHEQRAPLITNKSLARVYGKLGLSPFLLDVWQPRVALNDHADLNDAESVVFGAALESLVGAIQNDGGDNSTFQFIEKFIIEDTVFIDGLEARVPLPHQTAPQSSVSHAGATRSPRIVTSMAPRCSGGDGSEKKRILASKYVSYPHMLHTLIGPKGVRYTVDQTQGIGNLYIDGHLKASFPHAGVSKKRVGKTEKAILAKKYLQSLYTIEGAPSKKQNPPIYDHYGQEDIGVAAAIGTLKPEHLPDETLGATKNYSQVLEQIRRARRLPNYGYKKLSDGSYGFFIAQPGKKKKFSKAPPVFTVQCAGKKAAKNMLAHLAIQNIEQWSSLR